MADLEKIVSFLDEYLKLSDFSGDADRSWNGLQFEGRKEVRKIVVAVDAAVETFEKAAKSGADMVLVHHGMFWSGQNPSIRGMNAERIRILSENGMSLYAAHLPLDRHPECGNNAELLRLLGAKVKEEFDGAEYRIKVGWIGELDNPMDRKEIAAKLEKDLGAECRTLFFGKEKVRTIASSSGGAGHPGIFEAKKKNVDLYITGDAVEVYHFAKDSGMNVIFAGHHATETLGVRALGKAIEKKFRDVKSEFIDIPTGL